MSKHMTPLALAGTVALLGLGTATQAKTMLSGTDKLFVTKVGQGNIAEVQSSRIALTHTTNPNVLMVARRLIKDHTTAQADLKQTEGKLGVSVPSDTDPMHKAKARQLMSLRGAAFDKAYMAGQVKDHDKTVALFKYELVKGTDSNTRGFAAKYLPGIQDHTIMIHNVASNINADPSKMHNMKTSHM